MFDLKSLRPDAILLKDMKIGQKFYEADYTNPLVYELLDLFVDDQDPDKIAYVVRVYKTDVIEKKGVNGDGVRDRQYVFRYVRRDRSSYIAGFQACMKLYHEHMQPFDRSNAGIDDGWNTYNTMYQMYRRWVKNIEI